jgi:hypothetical protein
MVETWAVDLVSVGPIYPMVGSEVVLWIIGIVLWVLWHIWQGRHENATYAEERRNLDTPEKLHKAMTEGRLD